MPEPASPSQLWAARDACGKPFLALAKAPLPKLPIGTRVKGEAAVSAVRNGYSQQKAEE